MIRYILLSFIFIVYSYASHSYEKALYEKIFPLIFHKKIVKIYTYKPYKKIFKNSKKIIIVNNCQKSDLYFGNLKDDFFCKNKPLFVTTYKDFENNDNVIGAFYWRKGRPQLRFREKAFKKFYLLFPKAFRKYAQ